MAVPVFIAEGLGYALLFALNGIVLGLLCGAITGVLLGIVTCVFHFPLQNAAKYERQAVTGYICVSALSMCVLSFLQFKTPEMNGGQYAAPAADLFLTVLVPFILMGLLSGLVSFGLTSWYISQNPVT